MKKIGTISIVLLLLNACGGEGGEGGEGGGTTPVSSFGIAGKVEFDDGGNDFGNGIVEDANGNLVVVATHQPLGSSNAAILMFDEDGNADTNFDSDGFVATDGRGAGFGNAILLDGSGKILITGTVSLALNGYLPNGDTRIDVALWRYNIDGTPDSGFGTNGRTLSLTTSNTGETVRGEAIAVDTNGNIVVAGTLSRGTFTTYVDLKIWRFKPDGSMDETFAGFQNGATLRSFGVNYFVDNMILDAANNIYVVGSIYFPGGASIPASSEPAVWKYTEGGQTDTNFGSSGIVTVNGTEIGSYGHDIAFDSMSNLLVAGTKTDDNDPSRTGMAVWRFDSDGTLDTTFGNAGEAVFYEGDNSAGRGIFIDVNDVIYVTGSSTGNVDVVNDGARVWRLTANGALDSSYGNGGVIALASDPKASGNRIIKTMDNNIVIVGKSRNINYDVVLWKIN